MSSTNRFFRSRYNFFVHRSDGVLAYNARTGIFALLSPECAELLCADGPLPLDWDPGQLLDMGFVHHGNELNLIEERFHQVREGQDRLSLTIAPTLACNFSCDYCYQNDVRNGTVMSSATQAAFLRFVERKVKEGRHEVACTWYGGEPLLAKHVVLDLSRRLRDTVDRAGGKLNDMSIVTNGTLLDINTASDLVSEGISSAQISFDSLLYSAPDKRGVITSDGKPSRILSNVISSQHILNITVRINVSKSNSSEIKDILSVLGEHGLQSRAYLARITDDEGGAGSCSKMRSAAKRSAPAHKTNIISLPVLSSQSVRFDRAQYAQFEDEVYLSRPDALLAMVSKLEPVSHPCGATTGNLFIVDPEGYISRCWESIGSPQESDGNVNQLTALPEDGAISKQWMDYSVFRYSECNTCPVLPLCMGGCAHPRLFMKSEQPPCESIRYQIDKCVTEVGRHLRVTEGQKAVVGLSSN